MYKNNNKKFGFTLIELLVVVAIISLLSSIVFASLNGARDKPRIAAGKTQFSNLTSVLYENAYVMWNFNEGVGSATTTDFGPAGKTGSINGITTTFVNGIKGSGIEFSGVDSSHVVSSTNINRTSESWTMATWVNMNARQNIFVSHGYPFLKITLSGGNADFSVIYYNSVSALPVEVKEDTGRRQLYTWYYVVATYTGSELILYVDGKEVKRGSFGTDYFRNAPFYVGRHSDPGSPFKGIVDEVYYS